MNETELGPEAPSNELTPNPLVVVDNQISPGQLDPVQALEREFRDVFSVKPGCTHWVEHNVETPPGMVVKSNKRTCPRQLAHVIEKEIKEMMALGVIEPAKEPWRSYPVIVPKPDGSVKFCIITVLSLIHI